MGFQTTRKTKAQVTNPRSIPLTHATFRLYCNEVNPSPGVFNWSYIDSFLTSAAAQGQKVQLGLVCYDPDGGDWLKGTLTGFTYHCSDGGGNHFAPNFDNAAVQGAHRSLIQAFATKYNNDARVESIDVRSFGSYGEWHHYCLINNATGQALQMPTEANRRKIIQDYRDFFTDDKLVDILDDKVSRQEALAYKLGWRADCWGGTQHEGPGKLYDQWMHDPSMMDAWKDAPVDLEPCGSMLSNTFPMATKVQQAFDKHVSRINSKNDLSPTDAQWTELQKLVRKIGYRFVVRKAYIADGTGFDVENVGIAPNYRPIDFKYAGQTIQIPEKILPGIIKFFRFDARSGTLTASIDGEPLRLANTEWNNGIVIP